MDERRDDFRQDGSQLGPSTSKKRKRGPYKAYFHTPGAKVPESTVRSRKKKAGYKSNDEDENRNSEDEVSDLSDDRTSNDDRIIAGSSRSSSNSELNEEPQDSDSCHASSDNEEAQDSDSYASSDSENENNEEAQEASDQDQEEREKRTDTHFIKKYRLNEKLHPQSPHTRFEVCLMILYLSIRHCHTQQFVEDQIKLVNTIFGSHVLDISYHQFKNVFPSCDSIERHFFCDKCDLYLGSEKQFGNLKLTQCTACEKKISLSIDSKNYFITLSIRKQIENLLKRPNVKLVDRLVRNSNDITDIFDGELYKRCLQACRDGNFLTLIENTDGVKVYESVNGSLWPVFFHLNEIVPEVRFKTENLILGGLWFGKGAPCMSVFMKPVMDQLINLAVDGVAVPESPENWPVFTIGTSLDSVAKPKVVCQRQFNGSHSCLYCYHPNDAVVQDAASNLKHFDTSVSYPNRTEDEVVSDMLEAHRLECAGQLKNSSVRGFLGISILLEFAKLLELINFNPFSIVWSVVIDYLHALLEGVGSDLLTLYIDMLPPDKLQTVNKRLDQITLPQGMSRKPRQLSDKVKYKAKELRSFFLYFALPCFEDLLPIRHFSNLKKFVNALHVLLSNEISAEKLATVRRDLIDFVKGFQSIYGLDHVTYNLHLCTHLCDMISYNGPLWCYSNFIFESGNGLLVRLVRGTRSVTSEISKKFTRLQSAHNCLLKNPVSQEALNFCNDLLCCRLKKGERYHDVAETGSYSFITVTDVERNIFQQQSIPVINDKVKVFNRVVRGGIVFCSDSYSKAKKTNDCCVRLKNGTYVIIDKIVLNSQKIVLCLVKPIRIAAGNILIPSVMKCSFDVFGDKYIVNFNDIEKKCVYFTFDGKHYVCSIPNFFERD